MNPIVTPAVAHTPLDADSIARILEVTRQLGVSLDLDAMLTAVINAARDVLRADRGTVFLYDPKSDELYLKVGTGLQEVRFPCRMGIAGECAQTRKTINVKDCYTHPRFNPDIDRKSGYLTRSMLAVPLVGLEGELVGVMQVINKLDGVFSPQDEVIADALASQAAVALQRSRLIGEQMVKQKLERDLDLARDIQQRIWPQSMPKLPGYDIAGWCRPAEQTGGDIYDVIPLSPTRAMMMMGDATGHGIGSALSVTQVRAMIRMAVRLSARLDEIFTHVNAQLAQDLASNRFVTAFMGVIDAAGHRISYRSGGQAPLLHFHAAEDSVTPLDASTIPLGILGELQLAAPEIILMQPGDIFAVCSDGIFEAVNDLGEHFGAHRVGEMLRGCDERPMSALIELIVNLVDAFALGRPQADDMTILLLRRLPSAT